MGLESDFFTSFEGEGSGTAALDKLRVRLEREEFDLIAVGRALISDSQWARKVSEDRTSELLGFDAADLATLA